MLEEIVFCILKTNTCKKKKMVSPFIMDAYEAQKPETHFHSKERSK
jgi:hypothetical protein